MQVNDIKSFIEKIRIRFSKILGCKVNYGIIEEAKDVTESKDIVAIIGLYDPVQETAALLFPDATAISIVQYVLGMETYDVTETVSEGIAVLVEMVTGDAKARFYQENRKPIDLKLMYVIRGDEFVNYLPEALWLKVLYTSDLGPFSLHVAFQENNEIVHKNRICQSNHT